MKAMFNWRWKHGIELNCGKNRDLCEKLLIACYL